MALICETFSTVVLPQSDNLCFKFNCLTNNCDTNPIARALDEFTMNLMKNQTLAAFDSAADPDCPAIGTSAAVSHLDDADILDRGIEVVSIEANALQTLAGALDDSFVEACRLIHQQDGRVVVTGMGKSGHIGRKIAATFAATGTPASYVHPAEAAHGDLGMLVNGDVLVVISNSGNTPELRAILHHAWRIGVKVIGMTSNAQSLVTEKADVCLCLPAMREACPANIAPTTSTTLQLALGDALAMAVMDMRGFSRDMMKELHPGGSIGQRLLAVSELMHGADRLPLVTPETAMVDVIVEMTARSFGVAGVVDASGRLLGIITDGDLRRHFTMLQTATARDVMTCQPLLLRSDTSAEDAVRMLNETQVTCAFVIDAVGSEDGTVPIGIVHVHDFLRLGIA